MVEPYPYLLHFSEDATITRFEPRPAPGRPDGDPLVWAIAPDRAALYLFPRDCPRIGYWATSKTSVSDKYRFLSQTAAKRVLVIESAWLERMRACALYAYRLPPETFEPMGMEGYFTSQAVVTPHSVVPVGDLISAIAQEDAELRITPSLWPLHDALLDTTLHFSMVRMRNAGER